MIIVIKILYIIIQVIVHWFLIISIQSYYKKVEYGRMK